MPARHGSRGVNVHRVSALSTTMSPSTGTPSRVTPSARISRPWSSGSGKVTTTPSRRPQPAAAGCATRPCRAASSSAGPTRSTRLNSSFSGSPCSIAPLAADDERHRPPGVQRAPHLLVRQDAVLHAARVEERREARVIGAPELVVERQERAGDLLAVVVEQLHVLDAARPPHRSRELDVHAQQVFRHDVARRIDARDDGRRRGVLRRLPDAGDDRGGRSRRRAPGRRAGSNRTRY